MNLLIDYGCDEAQGYYFSRPIPGDQLVRWLETSSYGLPPRLEMKPQGAPCTNVVARTEPAVVPTTETVPS